MSKNHYEEIDTIRHDSGLAAVVTRRTRPSGEVIVTFRLVKEFQRRADGPVETTAYLNARHLEAIPKVIDRVEQVIRRETVE